VVIQSLLLALTDLGVRRSQGILKLKARDK
jgi:hypothetical protein